MGFVYIYVCALYLFMSCIFFIHLVFTSDVCVHVSIGFVFYFFDIYVIHWFCFLLLWYMCVYMYKLYCACINCGPLVLFFTSLIRIMRLYSTFAFVATLFFCDGSVSSYIKFMVQLSTVFIFFCNDKDGGSIFWAVKDLGMDFVFIYVCALCI